MLLRQIAVLILVASFITGCVNTPSIASSTSTPTIDDPTRILPRSTSSPISATSDQSTPPGLIDYEFPDSIHPEMQYLFYLHGKIIEDQGLYAVSPDYGVYEYEAILKKFSGYGFNVISEQRPKNADVEEYARRTAQQLKLLLDDGVPPENITVVGASKGAYIAVTASYLLKNQGLNFVLLGACNSEMTEYFKQNQMVLYGNTLAIYDSADGWAGSCKELFTLSKGKGMGRYDEIVLHIGTGHGILYQPFDEWMLPIVQFSGIDLQPQ